MSQFDKYLNLLESILVNAINLKQAGRGLLNVGIRNKNILPFAKFMFYASIEECGKFLLVRDCYPNELSQRRLTKIGFYDHDKKIKRLAGNNFQTQILRKNLRETGLYVDFDGNKTTLPSFLKNKNALYSLISLVKNSIKYCNAILNDFKKNPFSKYY